MRIALNLSGKWQKICVLKDHYLQGHIDNIKEQLDNLNQAHDLKSWKESQKMLSGFYSLVKRDSNKLFASVDHIRSYPLFYALTNDTFYLSDNAEWLRQELNLHTRDAIAEAEFQMTGYITGNQTLFKGIKQLQAGECLLFVNGELELSRYYRFLHTEPAQYNAQELLISLDKVAKESIQRLIKYANGRQIVIPLSGGYDSRLIATLLKEANYNNIFTFTYGLKDNQEAQYSKVVADSLGLKWYFVEYSKENWQAVWNTDERKRYQVEASNWTSLSHLQDWLAVKLMKEDEIIDRDAVFVPGHTGDMVAGGHIPLYVHANLNARYKKAALIDHLYNKHYCLTNCDNFQFSRRLFEERIEKSIVPQVGYNAREFANECEMYNWENRQAKFIVNSVRVYEFFGYDWWVPLWDKQFVCFFEELPLEFRNHHWFKEFVQSKFLSNINNQEINIGNASKTGYMRMLLSKSVFFDKIKGNKSLKKVYRYVRGSSEKAISEASYDDKLIYDLIKDGYNLNGRTAYLFLKEFS